jgi:hypothetical protein
MSDSTNLMLPYLDGAQAQKHVTVNEGLRRLDALVLLAIEDKDLTAPPGSPSDGSRYIPAATATGLWSGKENYVAHYVDGAWEFYTPREGFLAYLRDEDLFYHYTGSAWAKLAAALSFASLDVGGPVGVASYTVSGVPSASTAGRVIYVSDESGGAVLAFSDGTNWRRVTDRAVIS